MKSVRPIPHSRPWILEKDRRAVDATLHSGMISHGNLVAEFENKIQQYLGVSHAISQASGTAALILALRSLNIMQGDEVILPTYVCRNVLEAVLSVGASAKICDVDETGVLTADTVKTLVTQKTKAIIVVHIFGHPCDLTQIKMIEVPIIEDACQAFGLSVNGLMAGVMGDVGIFSFHATKCLTTGEGGMLVTDDAKIGMRASELTNGGVLPKSRSVAPMSDLQASLGFSQLDRYPEFVARRTELRKQYTRASNDAGIPIGTDMRSNLLFRFTLRTNSAFELVQEFFSKQGVSVRRGVDVLLHRLLGLDDTLFPNAIRLYQQTVSVPFYPSLTQDEADRVKKAIKDLTKWL